MRSVTDTSMMFMTPMPPTISDTAATLASSHVIVDVVAVRTLVISSSVRTVKSSGSAAVQTVTLAQQVRDGRGDRGIWSSLAAAIVTVDSHVLPDSFFMHRRVRHDDGVVLVLAGRRLPLPREHAVHDERLVVDADRLAASDPRSAPNS